jgi:hypothetical protein
MQIPHSIRDDIRALVNAQRQEHRAPAPTSDKPAKRHKNRSGGLGAHTLSRKVARKPGDPLEICIDLSGDGPFAGVTMTHKNNRGSKMARTKLASYVAGLLDDGWKIAETAAGVTLQKTWMP